MAAPVTVIVAYDPKFYEKLPKLFPHNPDARSWFTSNDSLAATTAFRNGTLQGAYLIIAARALGLDTGAMSGFDNAKVDEAFFADNGWRSNFLFNIGHGDPEGLFNRSPAGFDEAASSPESGDGRHDGRLVGCGSGRWLRRRSLVGRGARARGVWRRMARAPCASWRSDSAHLRRCSATFVCRSQVVPRAIRCWRRGHAAVARRCSGRDAWHAAPASARGARPDRSHGGDPGSFTGDPQRPGAGSGSCSARPRSRRSGSPSARPLPQFACPDLGGRGPVVATASAPAAGMFLEIGGRECCHVAGRPNCRAAQARVAVAGAAAPRRSPRVWPRAAPTSC